MLPDVDERGFHDQDAMLKAVHGGGPATEGIADPSRVGRRHHRLIRLPCLTKWAVRLPNMDISAAHGFR